MLHVKTCSLGSLVLVSNSAQIHQEHPQYVGATFSGDSEPTNEQAATPVPAEQHPDRLIRILVHLSSMAQTKGRAVPAASVLLTGPPHTLVAVIGAGNGPSNFNGPFPDRIKTEKETLLGPITVTAGRAQGPLKWGSRDGLRSRNTCPAAPQRHFTEDRQK